MKRFPAHRYALLGMTAGSKRFPAHRYALLGMTAGSTVLAVRSDVLKSNMSFPGATKSSRYVIPRRDEVEPSGIS